MTTFPRFSITSDAGHARLSSALFISPSDSYIELAGNDVSVGMGWAYRMTFAGSCVARTLLTGERVALARGVHGWAGARGS